MAGQDLGVFMNNTDRIDDNIMVAIKMARHSLEVMNDFLSKGKIAEATNFAMQTTWALYEVEALTLARKIKPQVQPDGVIPQASELPNL